MSKPNNDRMDLSEFLMRLLSQEDVTGFTFIMPGQSIVNFSKEGEHNENSKSMDQNS